MRYLTFSRQFPTGHLKSTRPTCFVEKILLGLVEDKVMMKSKCVESARATGIDEHHPLYYIDTINGYDTSLLKRHTIRSGSRWKAGDMASLRVWSGLPYRSKQIEFAQVEVKKVWPFSIHWVEDELIWQIPGSGSGCFDCKSESLKIIARNDGLEIRDFIDWFVIHPKTKRQAFDGQVISWSDKVGYQ